VVRSSGSAALLRCAGIPAALTPGRWYLHRWHGRQRQQHFSGYDRRDWAGARGPVAFDRHRQRGCTLAGQSADEPVRPARFRRPNNHRLVLRQIYNRADDNDFFRNKNTYLTAANQQNAGFRTGSNMLTRVHRNASTVAQLYSNFQNGWSNRLIAGFNKFSDIRECR
jgi:hypothetical protein